MKSILFGILGIFLNFNVQASEDPWFLCESDSLVASVFKNYSLDGSENTISLNLVLGKNILSGELRHSDSDSVFLTGIPEDQVDFIGNASMDYQKKSFSLKGKLNILGKKFDIKSTLKCKKMNNKFES